MSDRGTSYTVLFPEGQSVELEALAVDVAVELAGGIVDVLGTVVTPL